MKKRYLTLEDLYNFYFSMNQTCHFSSKENSDGPIVIQEPGIFSKSSYDATNGLLPVDIQSCHIDLNRNGSYISKSNMEKAIPSIYNRPILGNIIQLDDGSYDFHSHDYTVDEDGNTFYIEKPIGHIPESGNAHLEYDEKMDKTYVCVQGLIYEDYGNQAADIIRSKDQNKVSVELVINELSYNAEEKRLELDDFYFNGICCLGREKNGTEIGEGMYGANLTLKDFSVQNNSIIQNMYEQKLLETLDKINDALSNFQINNNNTSEKGGKGPVKLQELLEKYSITQEELTFEIDGMSDEELEAKFEEVFGVSDPVPVIEEPVSDPEAAFTEEPVVEPEDPTPVEPEEEKNYNKKYSVEVDNKKYDFEISLDEMIFALETIVNNTYAEADNAYYSAKVYDKYVVMVDYFSGKAYKQNYKSRNGVYSLTGDRVEVYSRYVTKEEEAALDEMRSKYSIIESQLNEYKAAENLEKKNAILSSEDYAVIRDTEKFKTFTEAVLADGTKDNYSVEDVQTECDKQLLEYVKANGAFSQQVSNTKKPIRIGAEKAPEYKPYGNLFDSLK